MKKKKEDNSIDIILDKFEPIVNAIITVLIGGYYILVAVIAIHYFFSYMSISSSLIFKIAIGALTCFFICLLTLGFVNLYKVVNFFTTKNQKKRNKIIASLTSKIKSMMVLVLFFFMSIVFFGFTKSIIDDYDNINSGGRALILMIIMWVFLFIDFYIVFFKKKDREKNDEKK